MKKTWIISLFLLGLLPFVSADMIVDIEVDSGGGDMTSWIDYDTGGGDFELNIDGYNMETEMSKIDRRITESSRSMCSIENSIADVFLDKKMGEYYIPEWEDLQYCEANLRYSIEQYMMQTMVNYYETRLQTMELRIKMLETDYSELDLCNMKIEVARSEGIEEVMCDDTLYYVGEENIMWFESMDNETEQEPVFIPQEDRMCERGFSWLCANHTPLMSYNGTVCPIDKWENGKCLEV